MFDHFEAFWMIQPPCLLLKLVEFVAAFNPTDWNHPWKRHAKLDLSPNYPLREVLKPILHGEFHVWWWTHPSSGSRTLRYRPGSSWRPWWALFRTSSGGDQRRPCKFFGKKTCWLRKNWRIYGLLQIWKRTGPKLWLSWTLFHHPSASDSQTSWSGSAIRKWKQRSKG